MLKVLFTLDYEIHGNGEGSPNDLMVDPTDRLRRVLDRYGAKLTVMADVAEILKFQAYARDTGEDAFAYQAIEKQLVDLATSGHDVQLHLHPAYARATFAGGRWQLDWSMYDFARLPVEGMSEMLRAGKAYLENLLQPFCPGYKCIAFRAANWAVSPSGNVISALWANGIRIDSSVFKHGRRSGLVNFDYAHAHDAMVPWPVSDEDMCCRSARGRLFEFPIYSELRPVWAFLSWPRIKRVITSARHRVAKGPADQTRAGRSAGEAVARAAGWPRMLIARHAWKADFNQCTGRQLIQAINRAALRSEASGVDMPLVMIGHSKLFDRGNERQLEKVLRHVSGHSPRLGFGTFGDFDLATFSDSRS